MLKKRIHFVELQDLPWMPNSIREGVTDYLAFILKLMRFYHPIIPHLKRSLERSSHNQIIDLCSGAGGALPSLAKSLPSNWKIKLTDLYPNESTFLHLNRKYGFDYENRSVDACSLPEDLIGLRTLFTSFHHFSDHDAKKILIDSVRQNQPIFIAEFTKRNFLTFFLVMPTGFFMLFLAPFVRPFKLSRLIFTYIIPLIPLVTTWDIIVTVLRTRKLDELKYLTDDLSDSFEWEMGEVRTTLFFTVTYLIGSPKI